MMTISVIIPCHNLGNYVAESIESALNQTVVPNEIIIIDDASTDNSLDIIKSFETNEIVKVISNEKNLGIIETFNKAIRASSGDYFIVLSADDWMEKDFIEKHLEVANQQKDCAMYYSDFIVFGSRASEFAEKNGLEFKDGECILAFPEANKEALENIRFKNMLHGTSMCSREWFDKVGGYRKGDLPEDLDYGIRVLEEGAKVAHVPFALLHYRQYSVSQTHSQRLNGEVLNDMQSQIDALRERNRWLEDKAIERDKLVGEMHDKIEGAKTLFPKIFFHSLDHYEQCRINNSIRYKLTRIPRFIARSIRKLR